MPKMLHEAPVRRFAVGLLVVGIVITLCISVQRLYASESGCASLTCQSSDACVKNQCDFCAGDARCALIIRQD